MLSRAFNLFNRFFSSNTDNNSIAPAIVTQQHSKSELSKAMHISIISTLFITTLRNQLIMRGISKHDVDRCLNAILMLTTLLFSESNKPLLSILLIEKLFDNLPHFANKNHLKLIIQTSCAAFLAKDAPFTAIAAGKLLAASIASTITNLTVTQAFSVFSDKFNRLNAEPRARAGNAGHERVLVMHIHHGTRP